jgi:carbon monoxide dehydrogenase subunit G
MPEAKEKGTVNCNIDTIWKFIKDLGNWAHCMPGYVSFQEVDDHTTIWCLKGDSKILKKKIELNVTVTERIAPGKITFILHSKNEGIIGEGSYTAKKVSQDVTEVEFKLQMSGQGLTKKVVNAYLKNTLSRDCKILKENVTRLLEQNNSNQYE